jgi:diketogulonate reductase-like aldo/keto reductase
MKTFENISLNNGYKMPQIGLGVYQNPDGESTKNSVMWAIDTGYRMIDTASIYDNEVGVGQAIKESGICREEIFVTTKVWNTDIRSHNTIQAIDESLKKLQLEYLDLILLHWCVDGFLDAYKDLEIAYKQGKVKAIGLSNFSIDQIKQLKKIIDITPMMNQIESHPYFDNQEVIDYCLNNDIAITVWRPLGGGTVNNVMSDELIVKIAKKYHKTAAQILIRWHLQRGVVVIPKSVHQERIKQNFEVFDFELTDQDFELINKLNKDERTGPAPENVSF